MTTRYAVDSIGRVLDRHTSRYLTQYGAEWGEYQQWIDQGNSPDALAVAQRAVSPEELRAQDGAAVLDARKRELRADALLQSLLAKSPREIEVYINAQTDLRPIVVQLAKLAVILARERFNQNGG